MKKQILILFALALSLSSFGQIDTTINRMITQKLDSFGKTLDSVAILDFTVGGNVLTTVDTFRLLKNMACKFTIDYINEDPAQKMVGHGQKVAFISNWGGVYGISVIDPEPYLAPAILPPGPITIKLVAGVPLLQVGNSSGGVIKWRFWIDKKYKSL